MSIARGTIDFQGVSKHFEGGGRQLVALDRVHLRVDAGESVALLGPNGAGKSTLLKIAAGVTAPSAGEVYRRGRLSSVIELGTGMHPDLTGSENLVVTASLMGLGPTPPPAIVERIIEFAGLGERLGDPVRTYSTGMMARLAFAVAAHCGADILLLDEVASVGDLEFQRRSEQRILELVASGTTVLLVTHDAALATAVCERAVLLTDGKITDSGPTDGVVQRYHGLADPPERQRFAGFDASLDSAVVTSPEPVSFQLRLEGWDDVTRFRIDLVLHDHAAFAEIGADISMVVGTTTCERPALRTSSWSLESTHIPPGKFDVVVALERSDGSTAAQVYMPLRVIGSAGPPAVRLTAAWEITTLAENAETRGTALS